MADMLRLHSSPPLRHQWRRSAVPIAAASALVAQLAVFADHGSFAAWGQPAVQHPALAAETSSLVRVPQHLFSPTGRPAPAAVGSLCTALPDAVVAAAIGAVAAFANSAHARRTARRAAATPGAAVEKEEAKAEMVAVRMDAPLDGRLGVAIQEGRRTISSLKHEGAFAAGWRIGDVIVEVNGQATDDNAAVKAVVKAALDTHAADGSPLNFVVRRLVRPKDTTRGMLRMTPGAGGALTVPMLDLVKQLLVDFPIVLFLDGTVRLPNGNLSALAARILANADVGFKAIDCSDEKYNPGVREAVEALAGEYALPQLYVGGQRIGNGYDIDALEKEGKLMVRLELAEQMAPNPAACA
eukprot:CAMPEP_0183431872 /NCGR_PEP_ID=MMETSP0370-20130417/55107_1 /TAXON_ID=268820 /ORGANISM="Peridinium aciculiferum, Strain PAER-2" /LENGTH=354 /DNA_ID=CAMNT_0025617685 /DNA_START=74 /DNA_END=1138 /DNA_ORIENTATION=-